MANYQEARVKLANTQLNKLKSNIEKKIRKALKMKNCHMNYL